MSFYFFTFIWFSLLIIFLMKLPVINLERLRRDLLDIWYNVYKNKIILKNLGLL